MRVDRAVTAITKYIPEGVFNETLSAMMPDVAPGLVASDSYALRAAYAIAACDQVKSVDVGCPWYDVLWGWAKENVDRDELSPAMIAFSAAYADSITVTEGTERLRVEVELPHSVGGVDNVEERMAHLMRMLSGAKNVKAVDSDPENGRFKFDFDGVNAKDVLNLLIKSLAAISGVLAIVDSTELPPTGTAGWIKKQITLARMAIALVALVIGIITGQVTDADSAIDILDGTPVPTLTPAATNDSITPAIDVGPFTTGTPEQTGPYPVPTAIAPYP